MQKNKTLIVIAGATASGKTGLAVQLAKAWNTDILSADSRQCYKELDIAVAKPSLQEMDGIKHYFIDSHSISEDINAGAYEKYALDSLEKIFSNNDFAVLVGGTGLYIKALCEGIDEMPSIPTEIRTEIIDQFTTNGLDWLQQEVEIADPIFWDKSQEKDNPHRLMRALEFIRYTGKSILSYRKSQKIERPFSIVKFAIEWPREILYNRINLRVDQMVLNGLLEEAEKLIPYRNLNALNTVGYKEIFEYFDGKISKEEAIEKIKINTRHYAKRQITWFKKDPEIQWININDQDKILQMISEIA